MSGHTKGPWHLEVDYPCSYNVEGVTGRCAILDERDGYIIATTVNDVSEIRDAEQANARLMSAAPDLLSELREILRLADAEQGPITVNADAIRAAIAKATGGAK